jgi:hypothetical protein
MGTKAKLGAGCLAVGSIVLYTLWASNFADYMHLEDLALENSPAAKALASVSPGERLLLYSSIALLCLGLILLIASGIGKLRNRRR